MSETGMSKTGITPTEAAVIRMWTDLLGKPPGSVHEDFFELGGRSLTLVQFIARVEETYGVELPVEVLFAEDLTVSAAARAVDEARLAGVDKTELDGLLNELDQLSDEEVRRLLADGGEH